MIEDIREGRVERYINEPKVEAMDPDCDSNDGGDDNDIGDDSESEEKLVCLGLSIFKIKDIFNSKSPNITLNQKPVYIY